MSYTPSVNGAAAQESFVLEPLEEPHTEPEDIEQARQPNRRMGGLVTWSVFGVLTVGAVIVGVWIWRSKKAEASTTALGAVKAAKRRLGDGASAFDIADEAYWALYPDCPRELDPKDEEHIECVELWSEVYAEALDVMPDPSPGSGDAAGGGGAGGAGNSEGGSPSSGSGPAARIDRFMDGLTEQEYNETRRIIGPTYFDQLEKAADEGDDAAARAAIARAKTRIENLSTFEKMQKFAELKSALGPKLDQLAWIMD